MNSPSSSIEAGGEFQNLLDVFHRERKKTLSEHQAYGTGIYVSKFQGMELIDYIKVASFVCDQTHGQSGEGCSCQGLLKVARHIEKEGFMYLKDAFVLSSPGKVYSALHARQKLLQMPLAAVAIGNHQKRTRRLVLVQKQQFVNYKVFQSLLTKSTEDLKRECFSKDQMKNFFVLLKVKQKGND